MASDLRESMTAPRSTVMRDGWNVLVMAVMFAAGALLSLFLLRAPSRTHVVPVAPPGKDTPVIERVEITKETIKPGPGCVADKCFYPGSRGLSRAYRRANGLGSP